MLFAQIYTQDADIVAVEPTPILWQLLKVGREIGEDRERNRLSTPIMIYPETTLENLRYMMA